MALPLLLLLHYRGMNRAFIGESMKEEFKKRNLLQKLTQFGLDPAEWSIAGNGQGFFNTLLLVHREDPSFRLLGEKDQKGWTRLQVLSV